MSVAVADATEVKRVSVWREGGHGQPTPRRFQWYYQNHDCSIHIWIRASQTPPKHQIQAVNQVHSVVSVGLRRLGGSVLNGINWTGMNSPFDRSNLHVDADHVAITGTIWRWRPMAHCPLCSAPVLEDDSDFVVLIREGDDLEHFLLPRSMLDNICTAFPSRTLDIFLNEQKMYITQHSTTYGEKTWS